MAKVSTTKGNLDEAQLHRRDIRIDDEVEETDVVEHWHGADKACKHTFDPNAMDADGSRPCLTGCGGKLVHRSVTMKLKKAALFTEGTAAKLK